MYLQLLQFYIALQIYIAKQASEQGVAKDGLILHLDEVLHRNHAERNTDQERMGKQEPTNTNRPGVNFSEHFLSKRSKVRHFYK